MEKIFRMKNLFVSDEKRRVSPETFIDHADRGIISDTRNRMIGRTWRADIWITASIFCFSHLYQLFEKRIIHFYF